MKKKNKTTQRPHNNNSGIRFHLKCYARICAYLSMQYRRYEERKKKTAMASYSMSEASSSLTASLHLLALVLFAITSKCVSLAQTHTSGIEAKQLKKAYTSTFNNGGCRGKARDEAKINFGKGNSRRKHRSKIMNKASLNW